MQKIKNLISKVNKSRFLVIGSIFIIIGIASIAVKYGNNYLIEREEKKLIESFFDEQEQTLDATAIEQSEPIIESTEEIPKTNKKKKAEYIAVLKIPKIKLEKGICAKNDACNNVNQNIEILNESDYPDKENGNVILASHSGNSRVAYFKNLHKLEINDEVNLYYKNNEYKYKIINTYDVEKTGTANIIRNANKNTLTLITCRQKTNKQIIIICELIN